MRSNCFKFFMALIVSQAMTAGDPKVPKPQIMPPGDYHGDEVSVASGEHWLAVVQTGRGKSEIADVTIRVRAFEDAGVDPVGTKSGKRISIKEKLGNPILLFRGIPGTTAGPAETNSSARELIPNKPLRLTTKAGKSYSLTLVCAPPMGTGRYEKCAAALLLQTGATKQSLISFEVSYEGGRYDGRGDGGRVKLLWAGDLNADGAIDLLIDLTDHYNVSKPTLFVSPKGSSKEIVTWIAEHYSVGC
ncbi:MAG: hypothetical protein HYZ13_06080 [Acidobacteria bacterium]|nr:hypothetical protein [Acidobacteriota bacterium]